MTYYPRQNCYRITIGDYNITQLISNIFWKIICVQVIQD